jgi:hypothetical protein
LRSTAACALVLFLLYDSTGQGTACASEIVVEALDRDQLIYVPGQTLQLTVHSQLGEEQRGRSVDLTAELRLPELRDHGRVIWNRQQRLDVSPESLVSATVTGPIPEEEGVYELRLEVSQRAGFSERFSLTAGNKQLATMELEILVLDDRQPVTAGSQVEPWREIDHIDPTSSNWWKRLPGMRRIPGVRTGPLGNTQPQLVQIPPATFVELPPRQSRIAEPSWIAYSLPIKTTGIPHLVEVEYATDQPLQLGVSVVEPSASGQLGSNYDSGVYVSRHDPPCPNNIGRHRLVFWPESTSPLLVLSSLHPAQPARIGRIRLFSATGSLPAATETGTTDSRLVAVFVAKPFGSTSNTATYVGYYDEAVRLADYVAYAGYNSAVIPIMANGTSIYPSHRVARTTDGASRLAPDGLEILLRVFSKRGLRLVPAIRFDMPLAELEAIRSNTAEFVGIESIGPHGSYSSVQRPQPAVLSPQSAPPRYNLLDDRVQSAMKDVIRELIQRYGHHDTLAGMAVQLDGDTYAQLPGPLWGLDDRTVNRFRRATQVEVASGVERTSIAAQLDGPARQAWQSWRVAQVSAFYGQLANIIRSGDNRRRLVLTTERIFAADEIQRKLLPAVLRKPKLDQILYDAGIDVATLSTMPGVVLTRTQHITADEPLVDRAIGLQINAADEWQSPSSGEDSPGVLTYHPSSTLKLTSLEGQSPWVGTRSPLTLASQLSPSGDAARRRFVEALRKSDPIVFVDGGLLTVAGQELATRRVLRILAQLPGDATFETREDQPLLVRTYSRDGDTCFLVANVSPWPIEAQVTLEVPGRAEMSLLAEFDEQGNPRRSAPITFGPGQHIWPLRLPPFDVEACRFDRPGVRVRGLQMRMESAATEQLQARIRSISNRDLTAHSIYDVLPNPNFEPSAGGERVPGWLPLAANGRHSVELDATSPHNGRSCVCLESHEKSASVQSIDFPTPPTGQLVVTWFARAANLSPDAQLHIVLETVGEPSFRVRTTLSSTMPSQEPLRSQWVSYAFPVDDLPLASDATMHIRFELVGPGEVGIDDVRLYDLIFPLDFQKEEAQRQRLALWKTTHAAQTALNNGQYADCLRLLDGYWPRFLEAYTPLVEHTIEPIPPVADQLATPPPPPPQDGSSKSLTQRLKGLLRL